MKKAKFIKKEVIKGLTSFCIMQPVGLFVLEMWKCNLFFFFKLMGRICVSQTLGDDGKFFLFVSVLPGSRQRPHECIVLLQ